MTSNNKTATSKELVRFHPFRSIAEPSFWLDHNARKLNELRLSEEGVSVSGYFGVTTAPKAKVGAGAVLPQYYHLAPGMRFDASSSDAVASSESTTTSRRNEWIRATGKIVSLNTIESLKKCDKNKFLNDACLPSLLACCGVHTQNNDNNNNNNNSSGGTIMDLDPNTALISTTCLTYCDLKSNMTVYWFAFPALAPRTGCGIAYSSTTTTTTVGGKRKRPPQRRLIEEWTPRQCYQLSKSFHKLRVWHEYQYHENDSNNDDDDNDEATTTTRTTTNTINKNVWCPPFFLLLPSSSKMKCLPLNENTYNSLSQEEKDRVIFGFVDPNTTPPNNNNSNSNNKSGDDGGDDGDNDAATKTTLAVGWTLRNLVAYLSLRFKLGGKNATFLSYRPPFLRRIDSSEIARANEATDDLATDFEKVGLEDGTSNNADDDDGAGNDGGVGQSLLLDIHIPLAEDYEWPSTSSNHGNEKCYKCVGWELNKNNKPGPRSIDLRPLVSPSHLARQANDLNLRLMKWRALPSLDVERLSQLKVLLLGAGTLGCGVARTLLGWGIRNITFVDSGRVSYSNPVRQSLFGIDDCREGGKHKAIAAAESLVSIAGPDVKSEGVVLTIPMPGHSFGGGKDGVAEAASVKKDVERLHKLIEEHDAVFLLTDTRESRWLPTVMALATNTPLINAALGLDSWLVMRHGPPSSALSAAIANDNTSDCPRLGCYFCSDVVAPENSTRDRTLDQQCTVTRPGLAPIAASMATELMVAMFHHTLNHCAPAPEVKRDGGASSNAYAPVDDGTSASSSALGLLPHQIRGTVVTYTMMTPTVPAFPSCTACSERVVEEYRKGGFDFVKCVCCDVDGSYLEGVSGLAGFREEAAKMMEDCLDWDDDEEDED